MRVQGMWMALRGRCLHLVLRLRQRRVRIRIRRLLRQREIHIRRQGQGQGRHLGLEIRTPHHRRHLRHHRHNRILILYDRIHLHLTGNIIKRPTPMHGPIPRKVA